MSYYADVLSAWPTVKLNRWKRKFMLRWIFNEYYMTGILFLFYIILCINLSLLYYYPAAAVSKCRILFFFESKYNVSNNNWIAVSRYRIYTVVSKWKAHFMLKSINENIYIIFLYLLPKHITSFKKLQYHDSYDFLHTFIYVHTYMRILGCTFFISWSEIYDL